LLDLYEFARLASDLAAFYAYGGGPSGISAEIRDAFEQFDEDHNGFLDYRELREALLKLGFPKGVLATSVLRSYDENRDGKLDVIEFTQLVKDVSAAIEERERVKASFDVVDSNGSGYIDHKELKNALTQLGFDITTKETVQILKEYDGSRDGVIDLDEWQKLITDLEKVAAAM